MNDKMNLSKTMLDESLKNINVGRLVMKCLYSNKDTHNAFKTDAV